MPELSSNRASGRTRRRRGAAQRSVILAIGVSVVALIGVWWVAGISDERAAAPPPPLPAAPTAATAEPEAPALPAPAPDAAITLVSGETPPPLVLSAYPPDALLNVDLALPVSLSGNEPLPARVLVLAEGYEPLPLDGLIRGTERNTVRLAVPAGWLEPGRAYLVEVRTTEKSHNPLRRFKFAVE